MTYDNIVDIIEHKRRFGQATGYEVSRELLELLEHPEQNMRVIHIAGTNGKGSTAAFISNILRAAGFVVGQFTSPHLIDFTERIQINGVQIPKESVIAYGKQILGLEEIMVQRKLTPTMFDYCLGIALMYFRDRHCDYVVLETGLGGRLDSTHGLSVVPRVSVFTNIGLDHTSILGNSLDKIAREKAGILREGTYAVLTSMDERAEDVIKQVCDQKTISYRNACWDRIQRQYHLQKLGLLGSYQRENAATAVTAVEVLMELDADDFLGCYMSRWKQQGDEPCVTGCNGQCNQCQQGTVELNYQQWKQHIVKAGVETAKWPGRMEIISEDPFFMVDGAHNPQGVKALADSLQELFPGETFTFVVGVLADKDYEEMMEEMLPLAQRFYTVTVANDRALQGKHLVEYFKQAGIAASYCESIEEALTRAFHTNTKVVAFGSLYFIGAIEEYIRDEDKFKN